MFIKIPHFLLALCLGILLACKSQENSSSITNNTSKTSANTEWTLDTSNGETKLISQSSNDNSYFGNAVAAGDFNNDGELDLAVGAYLNDVSLSGIGQNDSGGVYIYDSYNSKGSPFGIADRYIGPQTNFNNSFGFAITVSDVNGDNIDDLIVGAPYDDLVGANTGAVYIYYGSSSGLSESADQVITQPGATTNSSFGGGIVAIDLDGDGYKELIVGAPYDDNHGADTGSVWILTGQSTYIYDNTAAIELSDSTASASDVCGWSVWVHDYNNDGKLDIYMGCPYEDSANTNAGKVWIWHGTNIAGSWVATPTTPDTSIVNPIAANSDYFGSSILTMDYNNDGNDDLIIGVRAGDDGWGTSGSLYLFNDIHTDSIPDQAVGPSFSMALPSYYGAAMATADINKDGKADLIVGSPLDFYNGYYTGRVSSMLADTTTGIIDFTKEDILTFYDYHKLPTLERHNSNDFLGTALCHMDFNKDGLDDLVVGAYHSDVKYGEDGAVFIYFQNSDKSLSKSPDVTLKAPGSTYSSNEMGKSCLVMDHNRDGYPDLLIGAWQNDDVAANSGAVYIFNGTSTGTGTTPSTTFYGPGTTLYYFGSSLAKGDIDNDGFDDLIVGAEGDDAGGTNQGAAYIFRSDSITGIADLSTSTKITHTGAANSDFLGSSVLTYDIDGDGDQDLLVGAHGEDADASNCGMVYVWLNGTNGTTSGVNTLLDTTDDSTISSPFIVANQYFGMSLAKGKYKSNTYDDLFIGAPLNDIKGGDSGALYIFAGIATGYNSVAETMYTFSDSAEDASEWFGHAFDIFDINGNGVSDLFIGAPADDDPGVSSGSVFIKFR